MTQLLLYCPDWRGSPNLGERLAPMHTIEAHSLAHMFELLRQTPDITALITQLTDISTLERLVHQFPSVVIIVIDYRPTITTAVEVVQAGVADYMGAHDATPQRLQHSYRRAATKREEHIHQLRLLKDSLDNLQALASVMLPQDQPLAAMMPLHVDALMRQHNVLCIRNVCVDQHQHRVTFREQVIELSPTEFDILHTLMQAGGQLVAFEQLAASVHGVALDRTQARTLLSAHISNLRNKLRDAGCDNFIVNRRGRGYFVDTDAESALQRRGIELRTITENTQDIIAYLDPDGLFEYISPSLFEVLGYEADTYIGTPIMMLHSLVHVDDRHCLDTLFDCLNEGRSCQFMMRVRDANDHWIWLEAFADPVNEIDGSGMVVVLRDCSDRVQAVENLVRSESRLRRLIEYSPDYILTINRVGLIEFVNKVPPSMDRAQVIGQPFYIYAVPSRYTDIQVNIGRAFAGEYIEDTMQTTTLQNLEWINVRYVPIVVDDQVEDVMVIITDITAYQQAVANLRENDRRFRILSAHMTDLVALHNLDGTYLYISPSCRRLLGYNESELVGSRPYDICHPDDVGLFQRKGYQPILDGESVEGLIYRVRRKSGRYIWFETNLQPVLDENQDVVQFVSTSRDVSFRSTERAATAEGAEYRPKIHN